MLFPLKSGVRLDCKRWERVRLFDDSPLDFLLNARAKFRAPDAGVEDGQQAREPLTVIFFGVR